MAERILLAHGGGGRLTQELIENDILPALGASGRVLADAAAIPETQDLLMTTDAFVVQPIFFPGGDIGSLSVHGTLNDLAVSGAEPLALTVALVIEEGLGRDTLRRILSSLGQAAHDAGVAVIAGDTKVGPLARILVAYTAGMPQAKTLVNAVLSKLGAGPEALNSVLGRHAARAIECKIVAERCLEWVEKLKPGEASYADFELPESAAGYGLTEAPRGALGHWITIADHKIENYQCVVPTTWNCSPRDDEGNPGAVEKALEGTPIADEKHPIEAARVVRSFDPCIACAVH